VLRKAAQNIFHLHLQICFRICPISMPIHPNLFVLFWMSTPSWSQHRRWGSNQSKNFLKSLVFPEMADFMYAKNVGISRRNGTRETGQYYISIGSKRTSAMKGTCCHDSPEKQNQ
jgi:hypothetical protein